MKKSKELSACGTERPNGLFWKPKNYKTLRWKEQRAGYFKKKGFFTTLLQPQWMDILTYIMSIYELTWYHTVFWRPLMSTFSFILSYFIYHILYFKKNSPNNFSSISKVPYKKSLKDLSKFFGMCQHSSEKRGWICQLIDLSGLFLEKINTNSLGSWVLHCNS